MFFVPLDAHGTSDAALFETVGWTQSSVGSLGIADRRIEVLEYHILVWYAFLRSSFFDLIRRELDIPIEQDPALPLALALRDGAARAGADVAMLISERHLIDGVEDWYWMVLIREAYSLLRERFPLLYLGDAVTHDWTPSEGLLDDRDELPGGPGRTFFSQRGQDRWY
jgi:hypothetical protein